MPENPALFAVHILYVAICLFNVFLLRQRGQYWFALVILVALIGYMVALMHGDHALASWISSGLVPVFALLA